MARVARLAFLRRGDDAKLDYDCCGSPSTDPV